MSTGKSRRQASLSRLIRRKRLTNQRQIVEHMGKLGFAMTQACVSRDTRELGIIKVNGRYVSSGEATTVGIRLAEQDPIRGLITNIEPVGANLLVIRTDPGAAGSVAAALDSKSLLEMVGSVAGDDTIFVAVRSRSDQGRLLALIQAWVKGG